MNLQTQDVWIAPNGYDLKSISNLFEKRSGVIILTPEELQARDVKIAGDAFDAGGEYESALYSTQYGSKKARLAKEEYLNNLIKA